MCGIFGLIAREGATLNAQTAASVLEELFILSESRGKESSGIAIRNPLRRKIEVLKADKPASVMVKHPHYQSLVKGQLEELTEGNRLKAPLSVIAHSRLVTNGTQENNNNNQPVISRGAVMIHNGIITNVEALWEGLKGQAEAQSEVDTEVFATLFRLKLKETGSVSAALRSVYGVMEGAASVAILNEDTGQVVAATNCGSFYYAFNADRSICVFASEEYILKQLLAKFPAVWSVESCTWLHPGEALIFEPGKPGECFQYDDTAVNFPFIEEPACHTENVASPDLNPKPGRVFMNTGSEAHYRSLLEFPVDEIKKLKRCTKCILPETFPYIYFDAQGVCSYCNNYVKKNLTVNKSDKLEEVLKQYRRNDGKPDCIVAFSGGRDSSYGLHLLKKEFGMTPLTFTYDWGMVTDLARRNIARITGKLGIENILISADIKKKRDNVHMNVKAWLKQPRLGMIPLFMAGDKHFFVHVNEIRRQTGIHCDIWMENKLENTDFKAGFAGIKPNFTKERIDKQTTLSKLQMPLYYMKNFLTNPGYLNSSLLDTYSAFKAYYTEPREVYLLVFDYIPWNEQQINETLIKEYNWELSPDTTSTWRIGDGTAAFYNYIYFTVAGFSEFDTFRSNQIREGMITREEALELVYKENIPRYDSLKWYLDTIRIDFEYALNTINRIPRLYRNLR